MNKIVLINIFNETCESSKEYRKEYLQRQINPDLFGFYKHLFDVPVHIQIIDGNYTIRSGREQFRLERNEYELLVTNFKNIN